MLLLKNECNTKKILLNFCNEFYELTVYVISSSYFYLTCIPSKKLSVLLQLYYKRIYFFSALLVKGPCPRFPFLL